MTALVGIYCSDGVVIGADSAATSANGIGQPTIEQPLQKIDIVGDRIIVAGTGAIGLAQRFISDVKGIWDSKRFPNRDEMIVARLLTKVGIEDFASTHVQPGQYGALVAFPCSTVGGFNTRHLVELAVTDFQPEFKNDRLWYVSMGSGQSIIDPFLAFMREVFWEAGPPTVQDGVFAATWLLDHAVECNPGGVNRPVRVATLERAAGDWRARLLAEEELEEHRANIRSAKDALRGYKQRLSPESAAPAPNIPTPPAAPT